MNANSIICVTNFRIADDINPHLRMFLVSIYQKVTTQKYHFAIIFLHKPIHASIGGFLKYPFLNLVLINARFNASFIHLVFEFFEISCRTKLFILTLVQDSGSIINYPMAFAVGFFSSLVDERKPTTQTT